MSPGNTADVTTLIPVIDRLRSRFTIARVCVVAYRGLINTARPSLRRSPALHPRVRERIDKLVRELVLDDSAPFVLVINKRGKQTDDYEATNGRIASEPGRPRLARSRLSMPGRDRKSRRRVMWPQTPAGRRFLALRHRTCCLQR
jgi:hypothetical protein